MLFTTNFTSDEEKMYGRIRIYFIYQIRNGSASDWVALVISKMI